MNINIADLTVGPNPTHYRKKLGGTRRAAVDSYACACCDI